MSRSVWTVFRRPGAWPPFVARRFEVSGRARETGEELMAATLPALRRALPPLLDCFAADVDGDPDILEHWA